MLNKQLPLGFWACVLLGLIAGCIDKDAELSSGHKPDATEEDSSTRRTATDDGYGDLSAPIRVTGDLSKLMYVDRCKYDLWWKCTAHDLTAGRLRNLSYDLSDAPAYVCYGRDGERLGDGQLLDPIVPDGTRVEFVCGSYQRHEVHRIEVSAGTSASIMAKELSK